MIIYVCFVENIFIFFYKFNKIDYLIKKDKIYYNIKWREYHELPRGCGTAEAVAWEEAARRRRRKRKAMGTGIVMS